MVKCLNAGQADTVLYQPKHIKQPLLKQIVTKDRDFIDEQTKMKYFDPPRMTEANMERHLDVLYCKLQKVT